MGCIAYEMCTGHMLFPNYDAPILMHLIEELIPPKMYNPELPTYIEQAILKAMSKQPTKRHVDVSTFIKVLSTPISHPTQKTREEWMLEFRAIPMIYPGDKIKIIEACERAIRADSTFADAYFFKGVALDDLKRYEEALANFEHATQLDSTNGMAWLYKGDLLKHFNRLEEAQQAYKIARELDYSEDEELDPSGTKNDEEPPEPFKETNGSYSISVDTFNDEGLELEQKEHYPAALQAYEQAIRLNPNFTAAWRNKAYMLWRLNRYSEALEACEHAIQLNPYYAPVYTVKGLTLHSLNRYEEALTSHEKAIQLDPNIAEAYISKGHVLYELKHFDEALTAYEYTIQLDQSFLAYYGKGLSLSRLECFDEAITAFDQATLLKPNFADAYQSKGVALFNLKRYVQALDAFEHFIQLDPYKTIAWLYKGNILLEKLFPPLNVLFSLTPSISMPTMTKETLSISSIATTRPLLPLIRPFCLIQMKLFFIIIEEMCFNS